MREIRLVAIDLAKSVYHVHAVDARGELVERKKLSRSKLQGWLSNLLPCEVAMEACEGAHYWARVVVRGGTGFVRLLPPRQIVWISKIACYSSGTRRL